MTDEILVRDYLKTRSEKSFTKLYSAQTPRLYQIALRLTKDEYQSQELVQEMWFIAIRKLERFEWRSTLKTWLTAILINLFRTSLRVNKSTEIVEVTENDSIGSIDIALVTANDLEEAIGALPEGYRTIVILHDVEGYKHKEIAEMMDISEGTSKSQLFRSRQAIRNYLKVDYLKD